MNSTEAAPGPDNEARKIVEKLSDHEVRLLHADWSLWARPKQLPPQGNWTTWLLMGGRGSGKTRAGAEWVHSLASQNPPIAPIALVAETMIEARSVMVEGQSGLLATGSPTFRAKFEPSRNQVTWPNGAVAQLMSASSAEMFRGPQFAAAWCDELAKWPDAQNAWDMLQFGMRLGEHPRQLVTTTPRAQHLLRQIMADNSTVTVVMPTDENASNLAPDFLERIVGKYRGTRLGRQELDGELIEDREGALWTHDMIDAAKVLEVGALERTIVAVDPAVTSGVNSDACGIIIAALAEEKAVVLADKTCKRLRPMAWAQHVVTQYHAFEADCVVVETNQGGDLVAELLAQIDANVPVKSVHASRGKWIRAEPVAALYEQGRVGHAAGLLELENELVEFEPKGRSGGQSGGHSPDRLDALVWALTELMLNQKSPRIRGV